MCPAGIVLACAVAALVDPDLPVRLGAPAPDWAVEAAAGRPGALSRHVRHYKRDAALLVAKPGESLPMATLKEAAAALAQLNIDLLTVPPLPGRDRPGLEPIAPATLLVDAGGVVRRIEPGRLLRGKVLQEFIGQWREGREAFFASCARCHEDDGSLESCEDVKPLVGIGNRLTPAQVYERLRAGKLSETDVLIGSRFYKRKEVEELVVFVRGL